MIAATTLPSHNNLQKTVQEIVQKMLAAESHPLSQVSVEEQTIVRIQDIGEQFAGLKPLAIWKGK